MKHRKPVTMAFRRRCGWCGRELRAWQVNLCRRCSGALHSDASAPPSGQWDADPDRWRWRL